MSSSNSSDNWCYVWMGGASTNRTATPTTTSWLQLLIALTFLPPHGCTNWQKKRGKEARKEGEASLVVPDVCESGNLWKKKKKARRKAQKLNSLDIPTTPKGTHACPHACQAPGVPDPAWRASDARRGLPYSPLRCNATRRGAVRCPRPQSKSSPTPFKT